MKRIFEKWGVLDTTLKNKIIALAGVAALLFFCVFALVLWPRIAAVPELALNGEEEITIAAGAEYVDEGASATLFGESVDDRIYETGEVDTSVPGTYEINYNVDGRWRTVTVTRTVIVVDETAPEITLNGEETIAVDDIANYTEQGAVAMDNCDGDLSASLTTEIAQTGDYTYEVTYRAEDAAGNVGTAVRTVHIQDMTPPVISLNGDATVTIKYGEEFDDPGVTAVDDRDGDISASVSSSGYVDIYRSGTYTLTYAVSDADGNQAQVTRTVIVKSVQTQAQAGSTIYLTFDDGPSTEVTPRILDTLAANNIKATFFICDYTEDKLPLLKRMLAEGHTIGIHGTSHNYAQIYVNADTFMENIYSLRNKVKNDTGYEAFCIRFPGGSSNLVSQKYCVGVMTELVQRVTDEGLMYMDWNVSSTDASGNTVPASQIISAVEGNLKSGRANVVLMHDTKVKTTTADALQTIIDYGKANGYSFSAITENTTPVHHGVQN